MVQVKILDKHNVEIVKYYNNIHRRMELTLDRLKTTVSFAKY